jgi:hypothetical protein
MPSFWYRMGAEISEQQWKDIQGVLKVQGSTLDVAYLEERANDLNVRDLLDRARKALRLGMIQTFPFPVASRSGT